MSAEQRREQLLDVTKEIVGEQGFHAVSIEAVARRAGITRPVVYGHFGDLPACSRRWSSARAPARSPSSPTSSPTGSPRRQPSRGPARRAARLPRGRRRRPGHLAAGADAVRGRAGRAARADHRRPRRGRRRARRRGPPRARPGRESPGPGLTARTLSAVADEAARLLLTDPARIRSSAWSRTPTGCCANSSPSGESRRTPSKP